MPTFDTVVLFLRKLTHPALVVPTLAALHLHQYLAPALLTALSLTTTTSATSTSTTLHNRLLPRPLRLVRYLAWLAAFSRVSTWLSKRAQNNWGAADATWDWDREVVVVTGGSAGIGKEVVLWLSRELLLLREERERRRVKREDEDEEKGKGKGKEKEGGDKEEDKEGRGGVIVVLDVLPLEYDAPPNVTYIHADVRSPASIHRAGERIRRAHGPPTVVINNAGVCRGAHVLSATPRELDFVFRVNTLAHWYMAQEFVPHMVAANHGHVVTVASMGAYVQAPRMVDYNASKAAALSFHEGLAVELRAVYNADKVRTTLVTPSFVTTPLFDGYTIKSKFLFPPLRPETVAEEIGKAVMSTLGGHIVLPRAFHPFTGMRGWFSWIHLALLTETYGVMAHWKGRQVIAIEEEEAVEEEEVNTGEKGEGVSE